MRGALLLSTMIVSATMLTVSTSASGASSGDGPAPARVDPDETSSIEDARAGTWAPNIILTNSTLCCATQTEPHMAVNKRGEVVVGWKEAADDTGGGQQVGWTASKDGGKTWTPAKDLSSGSDIVFAVDSQDNMYLSRLGSGPCGGTSQAICVYKSTDGGATWGSPVVASFAPRTSLHDKNWIASDGTNLYVTYDPKSTNYVQATYSKDGGTSFGDESGGQADMVVSDSTTSIGGSVVVGMKGGGAAACFIRSGSIYFDRTDWGTGGNWWGTDVVVGKGSTTGPNLYKQIPLCMMVQDSQGRFYVAYPADGTAKDIIVKTSADGGKTWDAGTYPEDDKTGDQWHVQGYMCVDSKDRVHIGWRDERSGKMEMMYSNSTDGGKTWSPNIKITDAPTDTSYIRPGEYGGLVCGPNDTLYASWADGRPDGNSNLDIYFSSMTQGGGGGQNNAPATPTLTGPATGVTNTSYPYDVQATDPDADQVKYTVDWGDGNTDTSALVASGTKVPMPHQWVAKGTYQVKAMSTDARAATSGWSVPMNVVIDWKSGGQNNAPAAPAITGPTTGKTAQSLSFSVQGTDPDNDQVKYTVDWGDTKTDTGQLVNSGASSSFPHAWTAVGKYTVKAMSTDAKGATSAWGASITVDITDQAGNNAPAAPTVTGPTSVGVGVSKQYSATGTDPDNDQIKYTVDWGDTSQDTSPLVASGTAATLSHSWAAKGSYQVKAKSTDAKGVESTWGAAITVQVTDTPDDKPPVIQHNATTEADAEKPLSIQATITDDVGVASAELYYKPAGASSFTKLDMNPVGPTTVYKATIPAADVKTPRLEYYIEAKDAAGNEAKHPSAGESSPHVVTVKAGGGTGTDLFGGTNLLILVLLLAVVAVALIAVLAMRRRKRPQQNTYPQWPAGPPPGMPPEGEPPQQWGPQ